MKYTIQTEILKEADRELRHRLDARISEAPVRGFAFELSIPKVLTKGDTIELIRLPNIGQVIGVTFENDFKDVEYSIMASENKFILKSKKKRVTEFIAPIEASKESVYLLINTGTIIKGSVIRGIVQFI